MIMNNNDNIHSMVLHSAILEVTADNNFNSSFKVDSRLAEPCSGSGIWYGERSCVDGEQLHCVNEVSMLWIYLDIQINEKWKTNLKYVKCHVLKVVALNFQPEIRCGQAVAAFGTLLVNS
jgi:hypothetical protein